jgi:hypothetical protein
VTADDTESTTVVLKRIAPGYAWLPRALRERLTPLALYSVIATAVGAIVIAVTSWVTTQSTIHRLEENATESAADRKEVRDLLQTIQTGQALMGKDIRSITDEVGRQREWREKIEGVAELPPHARKRK